MKVIKVLWLMTLCTFMAAPCQSMFAYSCKIGDWGSSKYMYDDGEKGITLSTSNGSGSLYLFFYSQFSYDLQITLDKTYLKPSIPQIQYDINKTKCSLLGSYGTSQDMPCDLTVANGQIYVNFRDFDRKKFILFAKGSDHLDFELASDQFKYNRAAAFSLKGFNSTLKRKDYLIREKFDNFASLEYDEFTCDGFK